MRKGMILAVVGSMLWGLSGTISQYLFTHYQVATLWLTAFRLLTAGAILSASGLVRQGRQALSVFASRRDRVALVIFALAGLLTCQYSYLNAIRCSNSATAAVMQYLAPLYILLYGCLAAGRRPHADETLCIVMALAGVFLLATHGRLGSMVLSSQGLLWGFLAGVTACLYQTLPYKLMRTHGSLPIIGWGMLIAGAVLALAGRVWTIWPTLDATGWLCVAGIVLIGTVGGYGLYLTGVTAIGPMTASLVSAVEPLTATVVMCLWLATPLAAMDWLGLGLIMATVLILNRPAARRS